MPSLRLQPPLIALVLAAALAAVAHAASAVSRDQEPLLFGVITPQCFEAFATRHDFGNAACIKLVVSKLLGYAIITGSFILKLPQILKIVSAKDVTGLTPASFYMEVLLYASSTIYNLLKGYPVSTWGENMVILVQNVVLVLLLWAYYTPRIALSARLGLTLAFAALVGGMFLTPPEYHWALASATIPGTIIARFPQVVSNFKQGHTGQLAFVTLVLNFGGTVARLFTTMQETGDPVQLLGLAVAMVLNGLLVLQVLVYWGATNKALAVAAKKKAE